MVLRVVRILLFFSSQIVKETASNKHILIKYYLCFCWFFVVSCYRSVVFIQLEFVIVAYMLLIIELKGTK